MTETLPDVQLLEEARPGRVRSAVRRSVVQRGRLVDFAIMATFTVAAIYRPSKPTLDARTLFFDWNFSHLNVTLNNIAAIPEPMSATVLVVAGAMAWSLRRPGRRTRRAA